MDGVSKLAKVNIVEKESHVAHTYRNISNIFPGIRNLSNKELIPPCADSFKEIPNFKTPYPDPAKKQQSPENFG